jgi:hypothetical protein
MRSLGKSGGSGAKALGLRKDQCRTTDGDDPPVFGRYQSTDPWAQEGVTLSEHLILACLFEAVICDAKYGAVVRAN